MISGCDSQQRNSFSSGYVKDISIDTDGYSTFVGSTYLKKAYSIVYSSVDI